MLAWPHGNTDWADLLQDVTKVYETLILSLSRYGDVLIVAPADRVLDLSRYLAGRGVESGRVHIYPAATNDTWTRDYGPLTVETEQGLCLLDYRFNGWGGKFNGESDNAVTAALVRQGAFPGAEHKQVDFVLEGGAVETDGNGTLLTTTRCLLHPNRNPGLVREQIETRLRDDLGVSRIHWLEHGYLEGDDTDGHIDTLVRLCPGNVIVYQHCDDAKDGHFAGLAAMERELQALTDGDGNPYHLIPLPLPSARYDGNGQRLPAGYANFLIFNGAVLVPIYEDTHDAAAMAQVARAFPGYTVEGVNCLPLITQHGSLHCITMQLPKGVIHA